jgi:hypothetical protein
MSEIICTCPINNIWRKSNHIEDLRLQKDDIVKEASKNEASKQAIKRPNDTTMSSSSDPENQICRFPPE